MRELLRTRLTAVTADDDTRVIRRARNTEPFESLAEVEVEYDDVIRALDQVDRPRWAQLIDARLAPPRNDPQFEAALARRHAVLYGGFLANAVLVQSAVGKLQVKRMLDASGVKARVFTDEAEALEWLAVMVRESRTPSRRPPR